MHSPNPENLLIYRELLECIQETCHTMNKRFAFVLRKTFYDDWTDQDIAKALTKMAKREARSSYLCLWELYTIAPWCDWEVRKDRSNALRRIREKLFDKGLIKKIKIPTKIYRHNTLKTVYNLDRSEFYEPN